MKSLSNYILEEYNTYRLNYVTVRFTTKENTIIEVPEKYTNSDIELYLNDALLEKMPSNYEFAEDLFGTNATNIIDAFFEFERIDPVSNQKPDIEFVPNKGDNERDSKLVLYTIKNLVYVISFDRFDVLNGNDDNIKGILDLIFKTVESNSLNDYPIELHYDDKNLEYKK